MKHRLLVVDDEPANLRTFKRVFAAHFEIETAESGRAALAILDRGADVALVVNDYSMPEMHGLELAAEIRGRRPTLPIVILSGYIDDPRLLGAKQEALVDAIVPKPFVAAELHREISRLLGGA